MEIAISRIHYPVFSMGPGKRVGIWFQGCSIKCVGCISVDTWAENKHSVDINQVINLLNEWLPNSDGLTISGGEPFDQVEQLKTILSSARKHKQIDTLVYSGYEYEKLKSNLKNFDGLIDALISGPFDISQTQSLNLRGSDNQELIPLTRKGEDLVSAINGSGFNASSSPSIDLMYEGNTAWMAGVPNQVDINSLIEILKINNVDGVSTMDKRINKDKEYE
ncbi:4Fe-4S single cluster domain-containing protein [Kangiella sp. TOML190]|uniref:4Fe-4S single cluster domain-containing protein n=1 Tax=Kangiella sp. TOML190 TaxID=2931351 RepID=UPI00203FBF8E|nr:4Fe-4S single cluster domain-containing protein [Kangiella sp. TOML190]